MSNRSSNPSEPRPEHLNRRSFLGTAMAAGAALSAPLSRTWAAAKTDASGVIGVTASGKIRGAMENKVMAFKGVPYGASTAGSRFLPPSKVQPWTGVRDALELGPASPQNPSNLIPESMAQQPKNDGAGSEDCLHLNVWTPSTSGKRPVMVWYHGGGYSAGSANWAMYNGANLSAKHDVVVVTVNHRLNVFGYLYLADLGGAKYAQSSNVGMLDIVQSLEWVRDNIANFGGDPSNVTIFGQSGGGGKVSTLMGMPGAKGLFHKCIAMSGSAVSAVPRDRATTSTANYMKTLGLTADAAGVDKMQQMPAEDLLKAMRGMRGLFLAPVLDGHTMPASAFDPVASPISENVPMMISSTETEITWSNAIDLSEIDASTLKKRVMENLKIEDSAAENVIAAYRKGWPKASEENLWLIIGTDVSNFRTGTDTEADRKADARKAPIYKHYFQWYSPVREGKLRAYHTLDIPFVFQNVDVTVSMNGSGPERYPLADKMSAAFVAFARTGNPNHKHIPKWAPYNTDQRALMIWNNEIRAENDPFREQRAALQAAKVSKASA